VTPWEEPPEPVLEQVREPQVPPEKGPEALTREVSEHDSVMSAQTFLHPPSPPPGVVELPSPLPALGLELRDIPLLEDFEASYFATSPEPSPRTPPVEAGHDSLAAVVDSYASDVHNGNPEERGTFWHSDTDNEENVVKIDGQIAKKGPVNFSRPRRKRPASITSEKGRLIEQVIEEEEVDEIDVFQPTLRDNKGWTSPFIFEDPAAHLRQTSSASQAASTIEPARVSSTSSRLTNITTVTMKSVNQPMWSPTFSDTPTESTRPSTATSTVSTGTATHQDSPARSNSDAASLAPSELSVQWTKSPKERLGLGGKVTRRENEGMLPWETVQPVKVTPDLVLRNSRALNSAEGRRQSRMSHASLESGKLKRLSMKLGRK